MSVLDDLKPTKKLLVMDLLQVAGVDVSAWGKNFRGKHPSTNPKYCYNWSFEQPGEVIVVCLWYRSLRQSDGHISYHRKPKAFASIRKEPGANVWNRRDDNFSRGLEMAYRQQLPVRVIVVDGKQRSPTDPKPKSSIVQARLLDPVGWAVTEFNDVTGECLLERGKHPVLPAIESPDLELSYFEGRQRRAFINHRHREGRARREKIDDAIRTSGGRLICEVPGCGFDFFRCYGDLGKGYAHVHHLRPLHKSPKEGRAVKLSDLAIVCANCHAMIHRGGECRELAGLISE